MKFWKRGGGGIIFRLFMLKWRDLEKKRVDQFLLTICLPPLGGGGQLCLNNVVYRESDSWVALKVCVLVWCSVDGLVWDNQLLCYSQLELRVSCAVTIPINCN